MKYEAEIDGVHRVIKVERADQLVQASVDDRSYEITLAQPEPGVYLLFLGACVYEARVSSTEQNSFNVKIASRSFSVRIIDRKHRRIGSDGAGPGLQHLTAPMPGKVVRILTSQGAHVAAGQGRRSRSNENAERGESAKVRAAPRNKSKGRRYSNSQSGPCHRGMISDKSKHACDSAGEKD